MELLGKLLDYIHVLAGVLTLLAGPVAILSNRNMKLHRIAGKIFFYSMSIVVLSSVVSFVKHPQAVFYQFLLGIAVLVGYNILRAIRAIQFMKGASPGGFDKGLVWFTGLSGLTMLAGAAVYINKGSGVALPILFTVFGLGTLLDSLKFHRMIESPGISKGWWLRLHVLSMFTAIIASTTAFTVNVGGFLPWYLQWFGPALLFQPFAIYFLRKRKLTKKALESTVPKGAVMARA
ncbi:MAG: hypothetical protein H6577_12415 [Lewinellaceae bacterium]|nr:hypothetical protein [Saprospiraceae bacterium]MCB9338924.1 hypothetical protein [Lewinellaceae bacterium]